MNGTAFIQDLAVILVVAGVVGWCCQRAGLSVVVGYLVAGVAIGPHTTTFALISEERSIETAAQVGLVFLMFSIGLKLSVRKLRRLGLAMVVAVFAGAVLMYYLTRVLGVAIGLDRTETLFLAGMLMVSSSSIISKVLQEVGTTHERAGQLAMGVAVLEDVVAIVMLTLLTSVVQLGGAGERPALGETLGLFGAFVVVAGIAGLLLVPWLLRKMSIAADEELQTLGIAGLLFALAVIAERVGYSLALGAFLLGTIVAETPHRNQIERTFEGTRDIFSAVFFVAIGMQIDLRLLGDAWFLVLGLGAFTLVARTFAVSTGLVLIGTPARDALRVGLTTTPIGEFSFVIAQLGVTAMVVPARFYPTAVGVSLMTTLLAPLLARRSDEISGWVLTRQPAWVTAWLGYYQAWLEGQQARQKRNLLWQLSRKRFVQIGVEVLFVTGLLVFSEQMFDALEGWVGHDWLFPQGPAVLFWMGLALVVLAPLVAIWRNISALALLYSQVTTSGHPRAARLAPLVEAGIKILASMMVYLWLSAFLPDGPSMKWVIGGSAIVALGALLLLKRKLVYWHSELEVELQTMLGVAGEQKLSGAAVGWLRPNEEWQLGISECVVPDLADCQGKRILDLDLRAQVGVTIVGIERQGYMIPLPSPDTVLYPRDKVLLMGAAEQAAAGKKALQAVSGTPPTASEFDDVRMEAVVVPTGSPAAGQTLRTLSPAQAHHVQIAGIHRGGVRTLNPAAEEILDAGDEVLVLGTPDNIRSFKAWLRDVAPPAQQSSAAPVPVQAAGRRPTI